ncbi:MAG: tRNA uridine-5-carboxymethylaminomethyl(34) synthesis GTPase MnmE [Acidobacteriales bacterium]|nr:tRNA uridine-5-carboxymethylaminomethyl(34) synthesis GTPase MnmE [Terriglobales bacterium]
MNLDDTIVAVATPPGRGGIGVIRLSGPEAKSIALGMLRIKHDLEPGRAVLAELTEPEGGDADTLEHETNKRKSAPDITGGFSAKSSDPQRIDEVVVLFFQEPHSYTTDDVIEISCHGSPVVLARVVQIAMARGARLAEPGEFTMRAFLNGRIDLTQAEAIRDLIDSQTLFQAKVAAQQLGGALSRLLGPIKQRLVELIAALEAGIDFAEDDISVMPAEQILTRIAAISAPLKTMSETFAYGKMVHQGLTLAIVGRPNVGKSSLFNRLVERERAIVTATPGTTRDLISETVTIGGIPVRLVDTAGIRHALEETEDLGIRKSMEAIADADVVLIVVDASVPLSAEDQEILAKAGGRAAMVIENKCDLAKLPSPMFDFEIRHLRTSAVTGEGIAALRDEILRHIRGDAGSYSESGFLTNVRHQARVCDAISGLQAATTGVRNRIPHEMLLLDLYSALHALDEITGATSANDILNLIFSTFCIGK